MFLDKLKMEFFGSCVLIFFQAMMIVQLKVENCDLLSVALGTFTTYCLLLWAGKSLSGAQYNPVITISLVLTRHLKPVKGLVYIAFQFLAAFFAISLARMTIPSEVNGPMEVNAMFGYPLWDAPLARKLVLEVIGSFFLVFAYYLLLLEKNAPKHVFGAGIAAVYCVDTLFMFNKTGCALNPARMFAYHIISNKYDGIAVFMFGPIIGGALGALLANAMLSEKAEAAKLRVKEDKRRRSLAAKMAESKYQ